MNPFLKKYFSVHQKRFACIKALTAGEESVRVVEPLEDFLCGLFICGALLYAKSGQEIMNWRGASSMKVNAASLIAKESTIPAGAAGIGAGTLLIVTADNLPEGNTLKPWLIWIAPFISVILGGVWLWLQVKIANYLREREVNALTLRIKKDIEIGLNNPNTSKSHRERLRRDLEKLERININRCMMRIESLELIGEWGILDRNERLKSISIDERAPNNSFNRSAN